MTDKTTFFHDATERILNDIDAEHSDMHDFVLQLRHSMTMPDVRTVMVPSFHQMNFYPAQGFCELASLAIMNKLGPDWDLMEIKWRDWAGGPHFFIQHHITGQQLDMTYDQYAVHGIQIPYALGRPVKIDRRRAKLLKTYLNIMKSTHRDD